MSITEQYLATLSFSNKASCDKPIVRKSVGYDGINYINKTYYCPNVETLEKFRNLMDNQSKYCKIYESHISGNQTCYYIE